MNYKLIVLETPIIISDEKLTFFKGYCYGTNVNNDWKVDVHGCASSDLGWSHPKVIAGYKELPYIDYSSLSDVDMVKINQIESLSEPKTYDIEVEINENYVKILKLLL